jgi:tripartite-type tricarboxylate transporter receptor subunit TctC
LRSPADGYTLLMASTAQVINAQHEIVNFVRDSAAIAMVGQEPIILSVNPSLPVRTLPEFIAYAKANPGKLSMASPGNGTIPHIAGELFKLMAGVDMVHVPYRGGAPALTDLMGGQVQVAFMGPTASMSFIKAGKIRALGVTSETRSPALPDIQAVGEVVSEYEASQWFGVVAPRGTAAAIVDKLNAEINAGLADAQLGAQLVELGETVIPQSAAEFARRITTDADKWANVIRTANIKI